MMILDRKIYFNLMIILSILGFNCRQIPEGNMITGGKDADKHRYPFIVSINGTFKGPSSSKTTYGAGALIAKHFVITTKSVAFVIGKDVPLRSKNLKVFPNYNVDLQDSLYWNEKPLKVGKKFCMPKDHPKYSEELVILKLIDDYPSHHFVQPIDIAPSLESKRYRFRIAGWGIAQRGNYSSKRGRLQEAEVTIDFTRCGTECPLTWEAEDVGDESFSCFGDEGGPVVTRQKKSPLLVGLLLSSKNCSVTTVADLVHQRDWIEEVINGREKGYTDCGLIKQEEDLAPMQTKVLTTDREKSKTSSKTTVTVL